MAWCCLGSLSKVGVTMGFLCDQGTEKAEESGELKEVDDDAGDIAGSQVMNVSVSFSHCSFTGFSSIQ